MKKRKTVTVPDEQKLSQPYYWAIQACVHGAPFWITRSRHRTPFSAIEEVFGKRLGMYRVKPLGPTKPREVAGPLWLGESEAQESSYMVSVGLPLKDGAFASAVSRCRPS